MAQEPPEGRLSPDLARLRDEVRGARTELRGTVSELSGRLRDPFGIRSFVGEHPMATAGVAAGCGLLVARALVARAKARPEPPAEHAPGSDGSLLASMANTAIRTATRTATRAAVDWLKNREEAPAAKPPESE